MTQTFETVIGVDPGMDGAVAFYTPGASVGRQLFILDVPTVKSATRRHVDAIRLHRWIDEAIDRCPLGDAIKHVYIEESHPMPKQGVTGVFRYGHVFGLLHMAMVSFALPITFVRPQVWKKVLRVGTDKDMARLRAGELMPSEIDRWPLKRHHNRAEAALIAYYGATRAGT